MGKRIVFLSILMSAAFAAADLSKTVAAEAAKKSAAELEKEKALSSPYPNDFGPEEIDAETLKTYPKGAQEGYKAMVGTAKKKNCQACHTAARPLNSRFVEVEGKTDAEREAAVAKLKKEHPEYFSKENASVWQIEAKVWNRYVKRMMAKPGCGISNEDGKKIWEFLVYDGAHRKIGAGAEKWMAHRKKLLADFKSKNPKRYEELAKDGDL